MKTFREFISEANDDDPLTWGSVTDNPAFRRWFGKSVVVDSHGEPLILSHFTPNEFTVFKESNLLHEFADSESVGTFRSEYPDENEMEVYLRIERPLDLRDKSNHPPDAPTDPDDRKTMREYLDRHGYDGVIMSSNYGGTDYIVKSPYQIKDANWNSGDFDPNSPDIED